MKIRKYGLAVTVVGMLTLFILVSICGAVESASQYRPIYPSGGFKSLYNPATATVVSEVSYQGAVPNYWLLRFYIPPAASGYTTLALFCSQKAMVGAVARLGAPPQCDVQAYSTSAVSDSFYLGLPWDTRPGTLQQLRLRDYRVRNGSGTISIVTDDNGSSKGEWLYVKILFSGTTPITGGTSFGVQVDPTRFAEWYSGVTWDSSGNPPLDVNSAISTGTCDFAADGGSTPVDGNSYTITVTKTGNGYIEPSGTVTVQAGQSQTFSFISDPLLRLPLGGSVKAGPVNGTMTAVGVRTSYTFLNVTQDMRLNVDFDGVDVPVPTGDYQISVYKDGSGTVSPAGPVSVAAGGSQTFTFTPASGWEVSLVTYGVAKQPKTPINGPVSSYTFTNVQDNMELGVVFVQTGNAANYNISVYKDGSGTVSPAGPASIAAGGSQTFTFTPASGWQVENVGYGPANGVMTYLGPVPSYTFTDVQGNMELRVVFAKIPETSTLYDANNGFPIYNIPVQAGNILDFRPMLNFTNPPEGSVDYYVGYISQGRLFMGRQELNGNVVFEVYGADIGLLRCGTFDFLGDTTWECDAFEKAQFQTSLVAAPAVDCFVVGVGTHGDLSTLQGVIFKFVAQ